MGMDMRDQEDDFAEREAELAAGKFPRHTDEQIDAWAKQVIVEQQAILDRLAR